MQILKHIAQCPYRAALIHRVLLSPPVENLTPLSALDKGIIIHHLLEQIWLKLKDYHQLKQLGTDVLKNMVERHIDLIFSSFSQRFISLPSFVLALEKKRLKILIIKWLEYEAMRSQAFEVIAVEKKVEFKLLDVPLSLRVDRIDQLNDGHTVVIDYKTARQYSINSLFQLPITEPQLPLYAIIENSDAIAVASVHGSNVNYQSIAGMDDWLSENEPKAFGQKKTKSQQHLPDDFSSLKTYWNEGLEVQMAKFLSGDIALSASSKDCQYCQFDLVCRHKY